METTRDDERYRAVSSRDRRFDGVFVTAVRTTGIYCRPSCPARTPARANVTFLRTAAAAQAAGYRACRRCAPDATPGEPGWDVAADVAGRAMRLVQDGVVDRDGVEGLAARLGYSSRQLNRVLTAELGAPALALARARRAQTARSLLAGTDLSSAEVAFAAGFGSVRQFNDTIRAVYASSPRELRGRSARSGGGRIEISVPVRTPFAGDVLLDFLRTRAVPGVERVEGDRYARTLDLPHAPGTVEVELVALPAGRPGRVRAWFSLGDLRDLTAASERLRRLLDADCDPAVVDAHLAEQGVLAASVAATPGIRVPGHVDGHEVAVRAVLGQQVSVAAARTLATRLVSAHGREIASALPGLDRLFPSAEAVAALDPATLAMPRARGAALVAVSRAVATDALRLDRGEVRSEVHQKLVALPGIGPWTATYVAMRALGDPDCFLPTDTGTRDALQRLGVDPAAATGLTSGWAPWRSYAQVRLWQMLRPAASPAERPAASPAASSTASPEETP